MKHTLSNNEALFRAQRFLEAYGLIDAKLHQCKSALLVKSESDILAGGVRKYNLVQETKDFSTAIEFLSTRSTPATRCIIFEASDKWTAFLDNQGNGTNFGDYGGHLSRRLKTHSFRIVDKPSRVWKKNKLREVMAYEARIFTRYGENALSDKAIYAVNDGGTWDWHSSDPKLPVEEMFDYAAHRKKDRFTTHNLALLLASLNIPLVTIDVFKSSRKYILIQIPNNPKFTCTFEQQEDPAFGYYIRGMGYVPFIDTHAMSVIHDFEKAIKINPDYEEKVRSYLEQAYKIRDISK